MTWRWRRLKLIKIRARLLLVYCFCLLYYTTSYINYRRLTHVSRLNVWSHGPMTSHGSATMTSLTDHSIESILRHRGDVTGSREASLTNDGVCSSSSGGSGGSKPRLVLECRDLWHQFYSLSTEMVITKSGRFVWACPNPRGRADRRGGSKYSLNSRGGSYGSRILEAIAWPVHCAWLVWNTVRKLGSPTSQSRDRLNQSDGAPTIRPAPRIRTGRSYVPRTWSSRNGTTGSNSVQFSSVRYFMFARF